MMLKWHEPDSLWALAGNNAGSGWTAQIQIGNRFLTTAGNLTRELYQNITHIPILRGLFQWR